jgi:aminopeptidase N
MPVAEITRAETARRASLVRVRSYDIELDFTRGEEVFGSVSVIRFGCAEPGSPTYVDLVAETVREITLNGVPLDPDAAYRDGRVTLASTEADNVLTVKADCAYTHSGTGMHRSADSADGRVYVYGKFTPAYARTAYACFEQPDLKAPFTFTVTAPAHWTILSNQDPDTERSRRNARIVRFRPTVPLPTFATTVVAGDYHVVTSAHVTPDGREIPLMLACRASLAEYLDSGAVFTLTGQGLDYYEKLLGREYPYGKYGHAFVPEFSAGATEKPGCVLLSERMLFRGTVTESLREIRTMIVLHEMAHMWFGNLVTARWWDDLWLSESFAEFCGHDASVRLGLHADAWTTFSLTRKSWGFAQDRLPTTHPVSADAGTLGEAVANFDGISYAKGAAVLRQLTGYVGEDAFFGGIRDYLAAHAFGNATLPDLLDAVAARVGEDGAGADLAAWGRSWLQTAGPNTLRPEFATGPDGRFTSFAIVQEAPDGHPVLRPHHVSIGLYRRGEDGTVTRERCVEADVAGSRTEVRALAGVARPDLVVLNDDDRGYVLTRFDPGSLRAILAVAGEVPEPAARAACWNALADMTSQAELPLPEFARAVAAALRREPTGAPRREPPAAEAQALAGLAQPLIERLAGPAQAAAAKEELAAAAADLLLAAAPGGDHQLAWAQLLSWTATSDQQLDLVAGILSEVVEVPGLPLETELRWALLRQLAAAGRAGDTEISAERDRDPTEAGLRNAAACRAAIPEAVHKKAAWELLTSGTLGPESVRAVARGFMLPEHAALLEPYSAAYLPALAELWDGRGGHLRALLGQVLFPFPVVSASLLESLDGFATARADDPGLARMLAELADHGSRALRSRASDSRASDSRARDSRASDSNVCT